MTLPRLASVIDRLCRAINPETVPPSTTNEGRSVKMKFSHVIHIQSSNCWGANLSILYRLMYVQHQMGLLSMPNPDTDLRKYGFKLRNGASACILTREMGGLRVQGIEDVEGISNVLRSSIVATYFSFGTRSWGREPSSVSLSSVECEGYACVHHLRHSMQLGPLRYRHLPGREYLAATRYMT